MRENMRNNFDEILEELIFTGVKRLLPYLIDYKESIEEGDLYRKNIAERSLIEILPEFNEIELRALLKIKPCRKE